MCLTCYIIFSYFYCLLYYYFYFHIVFILFYVCFVFFFFFSSRRRHTRYIGDRSSDVCSSDLHSTTTGVSSENPPMRCSPAGSNRHSRTFRSITSASGICPSAARFACGRMSTSNAPERRRDRKSVV